MPAFLTRVRWLPLIGWIALAQMAGILGSIATSANVRDWYVFLEKPALAPPNWVFGPVWITLYFLMGLAAYLVWRYGKGACRRGALLEFCFQLALNTLWSVLFFGLQSPALGLVCILALWISIVVTIVLFARVSKTAAWLMVPYLAWVSFATYLNYMLWVLN